MFLVFVIECFQDINMNDETSADQTDLSTSPPPPPYVPPPPPPPPPSLALSSFTVHEPPDRLSRCDSAKGELGERESSCVPKHSRLRDSGCEIIQGEATHRSTSVLKS